MDVNVRTAGGGEVATAVPAGVVRVLVELLLAGMMVLATLAGEGIAAAGEPAAAGSWPAQAVRDAGREPTGPPAPAVDTATISSASSGTTSARRCWAPTTRRSGSGWRSGGWSHRCG